MKLSQLKIVVLCCVLVTTLVIVGFLFYLSENRKTPTRFGNIESNINSFIVTEVLVNRVVGDSSYYYQPSDVGKDLFFADIGIELESFFDCPDEAITVEQAEGSILGSHGIDVAITYFYPNIDENMCSKSNSPKKYLAYVKWNRRSDTDWKIIIPGYRQIGKTGFPLFLADINAKTSINQHTMTRYLSLSPKNTLSRAISYTNGPPFVGKPKLSFDASRSQVVLSGEVRFPNSCSVGEPITKAQQWKTDSGNIYAWMSLSYKSESNICPMIFSPVTKKVTFSFEIDPGATSATVLIPNYPLRKDLPLFIDTIFVN